MADTIGDGVTTITPDQIDGYEARRPSNTLVRAVVGASAPSVSFRSPGLRAGSLTCVFETAAAADDLVDLLNSGSVLELSSTSRPNIDMDFVHTGDSAEALDDETRDVWVVTFDWQEV